MTASEPLTIEINGQSVTASMDEWRCVARAVQDRSYADLKARQAEQRAAGQVWLAVYWRYYSVYSQEFFSFEDARCFLEGSWENGDIGGPHAIKLPSGEYVDRNGKPESSEDATSWGAELRGGAS